MILKDFVYDSIKATTLGGYAITGRDVARHERHIEEIKHCGYLFQDRSRGFEKLCIILAGYKQDVWDVVFSRLSAFLPDDVDVCVMTSGLQNQTLMDLAREKGWSYLATEVNQLSVIQNLAIERHPNAQWIYKIDEDMFLTKGFFETMLATYEAVEKNSLYCPAFVSPLINISCYGQLRLLKKLNLIDDFKSRFDFEVKHTDGLRHHVEMLQSPEVAKYMWGEHREELRSLDALTEVFSKDRLSFSICPYRFSIGAILFRRADWEAFGGFPVSEGIGLGDDEEYICHYAFFTGKVIAVSENCVVGHLGYGPQSKAMVEYFKEHPERFALSEAL